MKLGKKVRIEKVKASYGKENVLDVIPTEILLTIVLNDIPISTIFCTPKNEIELAIGYLISNGYVMKYSDINIINLCEEDISRNRKVKHKENKNNHMFRLNKKIEVSCDVVGV